jgi:hypothetical protein
MHKAIIAGSLAALLWSVAPALADPAKIQIKDDPSNPFIAYIGPMYGEPKDSAGGHPVWWLMSIKNRQTGEFTTSISFRHIYRGAEWLQYKSASMYGSVPASAEFRMDSMMGCSGTLCIYQESGSVFLDRNSVMEAASSGLKIEIQSGAGLDQEIVMRAADVREFVNAVGL